MPSNITHLLQAIATVPDAEHRFLPPLPEVRSTDEVHLVRRADALRFPSFILAQRYAQCLTDAAGACMFVPIAEPSFVCRAPDGHACPCCGATALLGSPGSWIWLPDGRCSECAGPPPLCGWAVYESPLDFPGQFAARRYVGAVPTEQVHTALTLADVLRHIPAGSIQIPIGTNDSESLIAHYLEPVAG